MRKALQLSILPLKIRIGYVLMSAEVRTLVPRRYSENSSHMHPHTHAEAFQRTKKVRKWFGPCLKGDLRHGAVMSRQHQFFFSSVIKFGLVYIWVHSNSNFSSLNSSSKALIKQQPSSSIQYPTTHNDKIGLDGLELCCSTALLSE